MTQGVEDSGTFGGLHGGEPMIAGGGVFAAAGPKKSAAPASTRKPGPPTPPRRSLTLSRALRCELRNVDA